MKAKTASPETAVLTAERKLHNTSSACACRSTFSGSILGPALKLYTRAIINLSFSCDTPITQHRRFCGVSVTFRSRSIPVFPCRKQEHLCTKIWPLYPA